MTTWSEGSVGSWGSEGEDRYHLTNGGTPSTATGVAFNAFTVREEADEHDSTAWGDAGGSVSKTTMAGLYSWTAELQGLAPRSDIKLGLGLVTFASGYTALLDAFTLDMAWGVRKFKPFAASPTGYWLARPIDFSWSGTFEGDLSPTTSISPVTAINLKGAAATFKLCEDAAADPSFTGNIVVKSVEVVAQRGNVQRVRIAYSGSGALTVVAGTNIPNILPAGAIGLPAWDTNEDGVPDGDLVLTGASGKTYTGPAFISAIRLGVNSSTPISVSVTAQGAGALTIA